MHVFRRKGVMGRMHNTRVDTGARMYMCLHTCTRIYINVCVCIYILFCGWQMCVSSCWNTCLLPQKFSIGNEEARKERGKERESAAVADSIRHAGLQCKLLHGHRCGFMEETQGFSKCSRPSYPCFILETKAEGGGGPWGSFLPCNLCCLMAAISEDWLSILDALWDFQGTA